MDTEECFEFLFNNETSAAQIAKKFDCMPSILKHYSFSITPCQNLVHVTQYLLILESNSYLAYLYSHRMYTWKYFPTINLVINNCNADNADCIESKPDDFHRIGYFRETAVRKLRKARIYFIREPMLA